MRYLAFALAFAFSLGAVSVAMADCPGHSTTASIASADNSTMAPSTKIKVPSQKSGS
jgi:hypothetical protein